MGEAFINALGAFLPGAPVANDRIEEVLGLVGGKPSRHKAFVLRQNRIRTRHYALDGNGRRTHSSAEMAASAILDAVEKSEIKAGDITYLATSATLGDVLVPGLASHVHAELGLPPIEVASFQSVCASSLMALKSAWLQVRTGEHRCAAVSGSEFASRYFRPGFYEGLAAVKEGGALPFEADYLRFTLSDGAGAAILENKPNARQLSLRIEWIDLRSYADRFETCMLAGGVAQEGRMSHWSEYESPAAAMEAGAIVLTQDFNLLKEMMPVWVSHYLDLIDGGKIELEKIDRLCSHYSAHSLKEEMVGLLKKAGAMIPEEKWFTNLYTKGNTGTASIFIMLEELYREGNLRKGEKILCHVPESGRGINGLMLLEVV